MTSLFIRVGLMTVILLIAWQAIVSFWQLPSYLLPSPLQVFVTGYGAKSILLQHAIPTLIEMTLGFLFGILLGALAGILIVYSNVLSLWFLPLLIISQAIPTFAIAPLLIIWLGYGLSSKIATTILMIFFPVTSAFYDGLRHLPTDYDDLAKTMNTGKWRRFFYIQFPSAMPSLASGIRIAAVAAPIGAIVGEWVGASQGLGYLMITANARMQIDMMFAALIVIIFFALILYFSVDVLLRKFIWWQAL